LKGKVVNMLNWSKCSLVESDPEKHHGAWVFKGTRLPISLVFSNLARGATIQNVVEWYGGVTSEQSSGVLDFVAENLDAEAETIAIAYAESNSRMRKADIQDAENGFALYFSGQPFPGVQMQIERVREEFGGYWYRHAETDDRGWLCPAMFKYFPEAPPSLYVKAGLAV
jgi:uncharacterized protein (DUF433 family)